VTELIRCGFCCRLVDSKQVKFGSCLSLSTFLVPVTFIQNCQKANSDKHLRTRVLKETIIQKLLIFERKILRRIFGLTKENQIWRIKTNEKLHKLIKHKNIVNYVKDQSLNWFGHVQRMPDTRTVKKIFKWNPLTKRSQGRPKYRWKDNVKQDICQMKVKNWMTCVQDRGKWKGVVKKAITFKH